MLAIDELDEKRLQELADQVHQMQVNGEIWGDEGDRAFNEERGMLFGRRSKIVVPLSKIVFHFKAEGDFDGNLFDSQIL